VSASFAGMDDDALKRFRADFARSGGRARAKALTAKERKAIATKASKAAAKVRKQTAKERKAKQSEKFSK
jgi:hypothetical protein